MSGSHSLFNWSIWTIKPHLGSDPESSNDEHGDEEKWSLLLEASCKKTKPWGADSSDDEQGELLCRYHSYFLTSEEIALWLIYDSDFIFQLFLRHMFSGEISGVTIFVESFH